MADQDSGENCGAAFLIALGTAFGWHHSEDWADSFAIGVFVWVAVWAAFALYDFGAPRIRAFIHRITAPPSSPSER